MPGLYLETSAILRATFEAGTNPVMEVRLRRAERLLTSRLTIVEATRAVHRVRREGRFSERRLVDIERSLESLWQRTTIWEITREVCDLASQVAPQLLPRTLDAIHVATFLLASKTGEDFEILTTDDRIREALGL